MKSINIETPKNVEDIIKILNENGFEAFIVGGCVRDSLLNKLPKDWDITTNASPIVVIDVFENLGYKVISTGLKHGTVTVVIDKQNYEITTYRIDGEYLDNRRPEKVEFTSSLKEDLKRRDFTVNAMAYNNIEGLIDYNNGLIDLNNKIITCVGNAEKRFNEDGLRMLRAVRFSCQLNFELDSEVKSNLYKNEHLLKNISKERIKDEFCKVLISDNAVYGINMLMEFELMKNIIPELYFCKGFDQQNKHHDKDVLNHILSVLENTPPKLEIRLSALLHDIGKPKCFTTDENGEGHFYKHEVVGAEMSVDILRRLKFDNKTIEKVYVLVKEHMSKFQKIKNSSVKKFMNRVGVENLEDLFLLQIADRTSSSPQYNDISYILELKERCNKILEEGEPLTIKDLDITGKDLMNIGFSEGKDIGEILKKLLELVLDEPLLNKKDILLNMVKENHRHIGNIKV